MSAIRSKTYSDNSDSDEDNVTRTRKDNAERPGSYFDTARRLYLPKDGRKRAEYLNKAVNEVNTAVFKRNTETIREKQPKISGKKLDGEQRMDCMALSVTKDGKKGVISGNVKERVKITNKHKTYGEFGLNENMHRDVIKQTLDEKAPLLRTVEFDVIGNAQRPTDRVENAKLHAEMQQVSYGVDNNSHLSVSKPPCRKCENVLKDEGFSKVSHAGEGQNLEPKNWDMPMKNDPNNNPQVTKQFEIPKKKVLVENDFTKDKFVDSWKTVKVQNDSVSSHIARNISKSIKPKVNASIQGAIETLVEDCDREPGAYHVGPNSCAGTYTGNRMPMAGAYARASTWDAGAHASVAHARVNGPAAAAGAHASPLGVGAYANAEVARAEASVLGITAGVGLNANTGASIGVDGVSASVLGFGFSVGPQLAIRTPVADVSCSIM